jgi:hypothetical protein
MPDVDPPVDSSTGRSSDSPDDACHRWCFGCRYDVFGSYVAANGSVDRSWTCSRPPSTVALGLRIRVSRLGTALLAVFERGQQAVGLHARQALDHLRQAGPGEVDRGPAGADPLLAPGTRRRRQTTRQDHRPLRPRRPALHRRTRLHGPRPPQRRTAVPGPHRTTRRSPSRSPPTSPSAAGPRPSPTRAPAPPSSTDSPSSATSSRPAPTPTASPEPEPSPPPPAPAPPNASNDAFSSSLTTTVFSQRSMRWFGASPRRAAPEGQTSISYAAPLPEALPTSSSLPRS